MKGFRIYLAISGGFDSELILKSPSYFENITSSTVVKKGDTFDLWLNDNIFNDVKSGIVKKPLSIQCSGNSDLDKSFKDGTTLINNEDMISYEEF